MTDVLFICEKEFEDSMLSERLNETYRVTPLNFEAEVIIGHSRVRKVDLAIVFLKNLSPESEAEFNKLLEKGCNAPFVFIGSREICRKYYGIGSLDVKKYIYTPISLPELFGTLRHVFNEMAGKADPYDENGKIMPVAIRENHILVVDDDVVSLRTMMNLLADTYKISVVKGGLAALAFLEDQKPDLILLDYEMPDCDGPSTLRKIRQNHKFRNIPVIFLTGVTDSDLVKDAVMLKPQGYVLKSTKKDELVEKIKDVLKVR